MGERVGEEESGGRVFQEILTKLLINRGIQDHLTEGRPGTSTAPQTSFAFSVGVLLGVSHLASSVIHILMSLPANKLIA